MSELTHTELRQMYMDLAADMNNKRLELLAVAKEMTTTITALVNAAEKHFSGAAAEKDEGIVTTTKKITFTSPDAVAETQKGRKCGICGDRGHNKRTCPNAHTVRKGGKK